MQFERVGLRQGCVGTLCRLFALAPAQLVLGQPSGRQRGFGPQPAFPGGLQGPRSDLGPGVVRPHQTGCFAVLQVGQKLVCAFHGLWRLVLRDDGF
ncbi:hypothetical protein D3C71_1722950 [compost metagenome]